MLTTVQVILNSTVCFLLPLVLYSLATGSPAPTSGPLAKFYAAERHLNLCGNLFLLVLMRAGDRQARPSFRLYRHGSRRAASSS